MARFERATYRLGGDSAVCGGVVSDLRPSWLVAVPRPNLGTPSGGDVSISDSLQAPRQMCAKARLDRQIELSRARLARHFCA